MVAGVEDVDSAVVAAARAGDRLAFATLVERYRRELGVHCYRMLGSVDESEDMVQETFLRAWKNISDFEGRSTVRAWLYRIATNACLNVLDARGRRRVLPHQLEPPSDPGRGRPPRTDIAWLQPFPDRLWEPAAPRRDEPDAAVVTRETIELAFLAAIQYLPPRQRAVLILRDVLGWPAGQIAELLEGSVAAVNSASQRARATLREHLPRRRLEWASSPPATEQERAVLRRYMDVVERADLTAMAGLLAQEIRTTMPPYPMWFAGRDAALEALAAGWDPGKPGYVGRFRMLPARANRQPAAAAYVCGAGEAAYRPFAIAVLRVQDCRIAEITGFHDPGLFPAFGLPAELPPSGR
jgi:RNA polymerase sigma-70 factor, ECF subfamily